MADPIAIWGAVTGTLGLGLAGWRELRGNKRAVRVDHGWHLVFDNKKGLVDIWVYVMIHNVGRRPVHIEHVGWNFMVEAPSDIVSKVEGMPGVILPDGPPKRMELRYEIALNGETFEVLPDGPSVKIYTQAKPILASQLDPFKTEMQPFAVSVPEQFWWGRPGSLFSTLVTGYTEDESIAAIQSIADDAVKELDQPRYDEEPGKLRGLKRLILDGQVETSSEVIGDDDDGSG